MAQDSRPCKGCGELIYRTAARGEIQRYCSSGCRPRCSVEDCDELICSKGMCSAHSTRAARTGDPLTPLKRQRNIGNCTIEGCEQPMRKTGWCASHYAQWKRSGVAPKAFKYKWGTYEPCPNCGSTEHAHGQRIFCSTNCRVAFTLYGGPRPTETVCVACGIPIDLTARGKRGQLIKTVTKFCRPCKQDYDKYKMSARGLVVRDGTDCGICGLPVDMSLRLSGDVMRPSVDHILPRSLGGTHEPENLQLAHLYCNMVKSDRVVVDSA